MLIKTMSLSVSITLLATGLANANVTVAKRLPAPAMASQSFSPNAAKGLLPMVSSASRLPSSETAAEPAGPMGFASETPGPRKVVRAKKARITAAVASDLVGPQAFGAQKHPFTTKSAFITLGSTAIASTSYDPFRPTGKLWMRFGGSWFVCSASMIDIGIAVTAAHCVHNFGKGRSGWPDEVVFQPAHFFGQSPYGDFWAEVVRVPKVYYNGKDKCTVKGIVCENDVAVVTLRPNEGVYPGETVGYYGFGWNGFSFTKFLGKKAGQITQLGYPVSLNGGAGMLRTDSLGYVADPSNVIVGSDQTGGSSGGPWVVNLGSDPSRNNNPNPKASNRNVVVATTSWGFTDGKQKVQGASLFANNKTFTTKGRSNIEALYKDACATTPAACER
ncbi:MAG TPA: hypothetical protein VMP03_13315 [Methylomirabilota bacterium]|nr:hypothetical protein [Methylomirabilota bacterium]